MIHLLLQTMKGSTIYTSKKSIKNLIINLRIYSEKLMIGTSIDMICFNAECIRDKNQLFVYQSQQRNRHSNHSDDDCVNLHPHTFKKKYPNQTTIVHQFKNKYELALEGNIDQIVDCVGKMLKDVLRRQIRKAYDKALQEFQVSSCTNLLQKIKTNKNPQYELMILNSLFLENTNGIQKNVCKKMQKCQNEIIKYLKKLNNHIIDQFQKVIYPFELMIQQQNTDASKIEVQMSIQNPVKIQVQAISISQEITKEKLSINNMLLEIENKRNDNKNNKNIQNINESASLSDIRKYFKSNKTKQIKKANNFQKVERMKNFFESNSSQLHQIQSFSMNNTPSKLGTYIIRNEADIIEIQTKQSNIDRIIIYNHLEEHDLLSIIRKNSPKEIFINYQYKFSSKFIQSIPSKILNKIQRFQEFWDHDQFFDQRINRQYFPIDDFRHIKSVNKIHLTFMNLNLLPKLQNIWISNLFDLQQLKSSTKSLSSIKSLRIQVCKCCNNLNQHVLSEILQCFKQISSLKTFVMKCQKLNAHNINLLKELTHRNNRIQCIAIEMKGNFIPRNVIQCFSYLPLTKLSINNEHSNNRRNVYMDVTPITKIKTLKKLALTNMFFRTKQHQLQLNQSVQFLELDENASTKISSLPELIFISLFRCSPIYPIVVSSLSKKSKNNLYHLNLSHTLMDNDLIPQLSTLPQLKQLNLDRTILVLKDLFKQLSKKPLNNIQKLSLFHYNGDKLDEVDQIQDFHSRIQFSSLKNPQIYKISTCFPNLQYLNIAFCRQFTDLPEYRLRSLKHLCSNKQYISPAKIEQMKRNRGIQVYLYDGNYPAWIIPVLQKK